MRKNLPALFKTVSFLGLQSYKLCLLTTKKKMNFFRRVTDSFLVPFFGAAKLQSLHLNNQEKNELFFAVLPAHF
jgi:hypothetical protein